MPYRPIQREQQAKKPYRWHTCRVCGAAVDRKSKTEFRELHRGFPAPLHHCELRTDMSTGDIDTFLGATDVPRDRYGRPIILTPDGKRKAYTRCTTFVGCLEDTYNLGLWQQRMVAKGLAMRDDLLLAVSAHGDDDKELNKLCDAAREAAAASSGATKGTALHRICERLDSGENVDIPTAAKKDVAAYQAAVAGVKWSHIERITVHDGLEVAGTPDRIGDRLVWDIKTGRIDYGMGKIAMQLALYANSLAYDPDTGERTALDIDVTRGVVIHLPAGEGKCELVEVDLAAGWEAVDLARQVREWRKRKNLSRPYARSDQGLLLVIDTAPDEVSLRRLWAENRDRWTVEHTARAEARKAKLLGVAS